MQKLYNFFFNFKGFLQGDIEGENGEKIFKDEADLERAIVANILILFIGGFDTSSTMASATVQYDDQNGFLIKKSEEILGFKHLAIP